LRSVPSAGGTANESPEEHFEAAGLSLTSQAKDELAADRVLIAGPGGGFERAGQPRRALQRRNAAGGSGRTR
jgi:hypothetical protein